MEDLLYSTVFTAAFFVLLIAAFFFWRGSAEPTGAEATFSTPKADAITDLIFCICVTLAVSSLFSLFPFNDMYPGDDSSVFLYIGQMMHRGYVPYSDLFDHKGVVLYFIQYLGLMLTPGSFLGVWLLEIINMFASVCLMYRTARLLTDDRLICYLAVIGTAGVCGSQVYAAGNLCEEYAIPWIALALYIFLKYFKTGQYRFYQIVLLGVGAAIVLFLRVNMVGVWAAFMPVILIQLIYQRRGRDVGICAAGFILGLAIVLIPTLLYTVKAGCLRSMIEYYFAFNFVYTKSTTSWANRFRAMLYFLKRLWPAVLAVLIALVPQRKNRLFLWNLWGFAVSLLLATISARLNRHYGMVLLPMLIIPFVYGIPQVYSWISDRRQRRKTFVLRNRAVVLASILLVVGFFAGMSVAPRLFRGEQGDTPLDRFLKEETTESEDVLLIDSAPIVARHYLKNDRHTENRFFFQVPPLNMSDELLSQFLKELEVHPSDVIIVCGTPEERLAQSDNLGFVCRKLEEEHLSGIFRRDIYDDFYVYRRTGE